MPTHNGAGPSGFEAPFKLPEGIVWTGPTNRTVPRRICGGVEGSTIARLESSMPWRVREPVLFDEILQHGLAYIVLLFLSRPSPLAASQVLQGSAHQDQSGQASGLSSMQGHCWGEIRRLWLGDCISPQMKRL